jgi:hypothetical protein
MNGSDRSIELKMCPPPVSNCIASNRNQSGTEYADIVHWETRYFRNSFDPKFFRVAASKTASPSLLKSVCYRTNQRHASGMWFFECQFIKFSSAYLLFNCNFIYPLEVHVESEQWRIHLCLCIRVALNARQPRREHSVISHAYKKINAAAERCMCIICCHPPGCGTI